MPNDSMRTVLVALGAGFGVALAKAGAAAFTGSSALAAEAAHSLADTANDLVEYITNLYREAHAHGFDARVLVLDGSITLVFGKERVTYGPGDSCSVPAGTVHEEHTDADGVRYVSGRRPLPHEAAARS